MKTANVERLLHGSIMPRYLLIVPILRHGYKTKRWTGSQSCLVGLVIMLTSFIVTLRTIHAEDGHADDRRNSQLQPHLKSWSRKILNADERFVVLSAFSREVSGPFHFGAA